MTRLSTFSIQSLIATILIAVLAGNTWATGTKGTQKPPNKHTRHAKAKTAPTIGPLYATRPDVMEAADAMAQRTGINAEWLRLTLGQANYLPAVARAIAPPPIGMPKNWAVYRSRFVEPIRTAAGVKFWQANQEALLRAQTQFGVPAEIIVGIIGVETIYGQQTGNYRVMDALSTLAFDFPQSHPRAKDRSAYFLSELEAFLQLTYRTGTDPLALRGSYAGAMGLPQFMPSSWAKYAIDFDGDGRVDLFHSAADVIGSVANYFKAYGWQTGLPTFYALQFNPAKLDMAGLMVPDILPSFTPEAMADKGVDLDAKALAHPGLLALIELQNGAAPPQYVAGTANFYTITRYNWSSYYAMAVIELGQSVAQAMPK